MIKAHPYIQCLHVSLNQPTSSYNCLSLHASVLIHLYMCPSIHVCPPFFSYLPLSTPPTMFVHTLTCSLRCSPIHIFVSLPTCLFFLPSGYMFTQVCPPICPFLSSCPSLHCLSSHVLPPVRLCLSIHPDVCLSFLLFAHPHALSSLLLFIGLFLHLSFSLYTPRCMHK